ncbi:MAG: TetR/AcrR family transcriptional regulator [Chitinispirillia bacterium]|jgi:AcrR family transcriptional regulator
MVNARVNREKVIRETKINIILDAAREVFSSNGFDSTRLEDIAYSAGFSKASLYNYYSDKESIFINLAIREYKRIIKLIKTEIDLKNPLRRNLEIVLRIIFSVFGDHFAIFLTISNFMAQKIIHCPQTDSKDSNENILIGNFKCVFTEVTDVIVKIIDASRKLGEINSPLESSVLTKMFGSLIKGVLFEWKLSGKIGDIDRAIYEIITFIEQGFGLSLLPNQGEKESIN